MAVLKYKSSDGTWKAIATKEGNGVTNETDPVFSASPAASITEAKKTEWDGKYTKPSGGIPASDLALDVFLQGEKGDKGDKGDQGEQGPKGDKGDKGDTGAAGTNGTNGKDGADGEDGATFTPSVDANGNLSWTNNKGLSNPPTVNIKGPKGDAGEGGGSSGGGGVAYEREFIGIKSSSDITLLPNKLYYIESMAGGGVHINVGIFFDEDIDDTICNEYNFIICVDYDFIISLPDDIIWANGEAPQFEPEKAYHISIVDHYAVFAEFNEIW